MRDLTMAAAGRAFGPDRAAPGIIGCSVDFKPLGETHKSLNSG